MFHPFTPNLIVCSDEEVSQILRARLGDVGYIYNHHYVMSSSLARLKGDIKPGAPQLLAFCEYPYENVGLEHQVVLAKSWNESFEVVILALNSIEVRGTTYIQIAGGTEDRFAEFVRKAESHKDKLRAGVLV